MRQYVFRRLLSALAVLWLVTVIVFAISRLSGSPVDVMLPQGASAQQRHALIADLGLDQPLPVQYAKFFANAVSGDFGESTRFDAPALDLVLERLPATLELALTAFAIAVLGGVLLGTLAGLREGRPSDYGITALLTVGQAVPSFWVGILLILVFGVDLKLLPIAGDDGLEALVLPAVTLSIVPLVYVARVTRSSVIGVLPAEYVDAAYAKGLRRRTVIGRHILRNGLIPVLAIAGIVLAQILSVGVIIEQIFAWPGVGSLAVEAIEARDYAVVQATTVAMAIIVIAVSLLIDLSYVAVDPRIRVQARPAS